jgi:hypothetical protein
VVKSSDFTELKDTIRRLLHGRAGRTAGAQSLATTQVGRLARRVPTVRAMTYSG